MKHREKKLKEQKLACLAQEQQAAKIVTKLSDGDLSSYYLIKNQGKSRKQQVKEASPS